MQEHVQGLMIERKPGHDVRELRWLERDLVAPLRMRSDRPLVKPPQRHPVAELHGHTDYVHAVAWSPDGTRLVSGSGDFTVRIWDSLSVQERAARSAAPAAAGTASK